MRFSTTTKKFAQMIAPLAAVSDECRLNISPSGITASVVDTANVLMVLVQLPKRIFESYKVSDYEEIGMNLSKLSSILEDTKDEPIDISITREPAKSAMLPDPSASVVHRMTLATADYEYRFRLPRIDTIKKSPKSFHLTYTTICHIPFTLLQEAIRKAAKMNSYIKFASAQASWREIRLSYRLIQIQMIRIGSGYISGIIPTP